MPKHCIRNSLFSIVLLGLLVNNIKHLSFNSLFLHCQSVLVPNEIGSLSVKSMSLHATFEQADHVPIVWVLSEC